MRSGTRTIWSVAGTTLAVLALVAIAIAPPFEAPRAASAGAPDLEGETHLARNDLRASVPDRASARLLLRFVHVSDAHVLDDDAPPPLRFEWLDRAGSPFTSAQRPQEEYTDEVLASLVRAINRLHGERALDFVMLTGDSIDNALENEWIRLRDVMDGTCTPLSLLTGELEPDPQVPPDAGLAHAPRRDARATGLPASLCGTSSNPGLLPGLPWYEALGNHNHMVQGNSNVYPGYNEVAGRFGRRFLTLPEYVAAHWDEAFCGEAFDPTANDRGHGFGYAERERLCGGDASAIGYYSFDANGVHVVVLDTSNKDWLKSNRHVWRTREAAGATRDLPVDGVLGGYAEGAIDLRQLGWLARDLEANAGKPTLVIAHHTLENFYLPAAAPAELGFETGRTMRDFLGKHPSVLAYLGGHSHRNRVTPEFPSESERGFWNIETASLIDAPMEARVVEVVALGEGAGAIRTTMLTHDFAPARALAAEDPQRDADAAGAPGDRDTVLYVAWR